MKYYSLSSGRYCAFTFFLGSLILAFGCSASSLRELPFLRAAEKTEATFEESLADSRSVELTIWHDSFEVALEASRETGKPILADFTGSDWCTWCVKLKRDIFETTEFKSWARDNVILLELDYPKRTMQSMEIRKQNKELAERYRISGYPTVLFLDSEGEVLGKLGHMSRPADWIGSAMPIIARASPTLVSK